MNDLDLTLDHKFIRPETFLGAIVYAVLFFVLAFSAARLLRAAIHRAVDRDKHALMDRTTVQFVGQLVQVAVYVFAFLFYAHLIPALHNLGTAWLASVSVVSVVVGLAAQQALGNLIAGISLLFYRPFKLGDRLQVTTPNGLETGFVESLDLGYTVLRTPDNRRIVVPNSAMASQANINLTMRDERVVCTVPVSISYESDIDQARAVLLDLVKQNPKAQEVVACRVNALGSSSVDLSLLVWCADAGTAFALKSEMLEAIKKRFDAEGIEIPYAYTNVIVKQPPKGSIALSGGKS